MHLTVMRQPSAKGCTLSKWFLEGQQVAVGLEDVVRPASQFVYGATAIPAGTYEVEITLSTRFKKRLPQLFDLPGKRTLFGTKHLDDCGVRIHSGNVPADTLGCLLVGSEFGADRASITASRVAFDRLFARIETAVGQREQVTITIA